MPHPSLPDGPGEAWVRPPAPHHKLPNQSPGRTGNRMGYDPGVLAALATMVLGELT
jgi:hypothetical protein